MKHLSEYKKILIPVLLAFLFFVSGLAFYFYKSPKKESLVSPIAKSTSGFTFENLPSETPEQVYNVLLLGHGDPGHPGGDLADSLIVIHLDTRRKKAVLISVPRDIWLSIPVGEEKVEAHKINEAYSVGKKVKGEDFGFSLMKQAVAKVTNLPIDYFVFINFGKFMEAIDSLGGIEVEVPQTFDDYFYPIRGKELESCGFASEEIAAMSATMSGFKLEKQFKCRYERLHFDQGKKR